MSSYINMSLDDIIQKKKKEKPRKLKKGPQPAQPLNKKQSPPKKPITDARNKIISLKRDQITDARDKLAELAKQKDARLKLDRLRQERNMKMSRIHTTPRITTSHQGKFFAAVPNRERVFMDSSRQVAYQPKIARNGARHPMITKKFLETRTIGRSFEPKPYEKPMRPKPIVRTIDNDIEIIDDPMGDDEYNSSDQILHNRKASLQLKIIAHNKDVSEKRQFITSLRAPVIERERSPPRPPSILKKRPMAALRSDQLNQNPEKPPSTEYRIIVSNLRNTVTGGDIEELFGDIGDMVESRLVRPGTAEVIYKTQEHAQKAVELYHNRQLDGQPMNCLLVTPRASAITSRNSSKPALYSTNSNVEPDISTFHKVLFSNM